MKRIRSFKQRQERAVQVTDEKIHPKRLKATSEA
jgi:hypothetical protein